MNPSVDLLVVGEPMGFWRTHMPEGMLLRSGPDWHLDPVPVMVERLDRTGSGGDGFVATLSDGRTIAARRVVLALGMGTFAHVSDELQALIPCGRGTHTCDAVDFAPLAGWRCLILGGRQSAFEWAALIHEAEAAEVHVVHRHASPAFVEADWTWVNPLVEEMAVNPGWFRSLPPDRQQAVSRRLWGEGRLKVEPWLEGRVNRDGITVWSDSRIESCEELPDGELAVTLDGGVCLIVDDVIFATGYKVDMARIPLLAGGNIFPSLETRNGFPVLSERFECSVPGLFVTSMPAGQDFGPFFGFTVAARTSAKIIGAALAG